MYLEDNLIDPDNVFEGGSGFLKAFAEAVEVGH
jgi:hypothetical protein